MSGTDPYGEVLDPRLRIGGNNPPEPMSELALMLSPAVLRDQLELDYPRLIERRDELLAGVERFFATVQVIETVEQQARAADFVRQLKLHCTDVETARKAEVKPLDAAKATHQKFFKAENLDLVERSVRDVEAKMTVFQRNETARIAAERLAEQRRLQAEADAAAALAMESQRPSLFDAAAEAAKAADRGPKKVSSTVRGMGSTVSLRTHFTYEEIDLSQVPREWLVLDAARVQAAINGGLRDREDGTPAIPGLRIIDDSKAVVR